MFFFGESKNKLSQRMSRKLIFLLTIHQQLRNFEIQPCVKSLENKKKECN